MTEYVSGELGGKIKAIICEWWKVVGGGAAPAEYLESSTIYARLISEGVEGFLQRNPHRTGEKPSWLSVALWADEYLPSKPLPEAVEMALAELGAVA
jgi:hypothetical protein